MHALRIVLLAVVAAPLAAHGAPTPPAIEPSTVPAECATVTRVPADATGTGPALMARVSLATCGAAVRFRTLTVSPEDASMMRLDAAARPSLDLLDAVIQANDATWSPIARQARADLFAAMAVRMRASIPSITPTTVGPELTAHDQAHAALELALKRWLDQAQ